MEGDVHKHWFSTNALEILYTSVVMVLETAKPTGIVVGIQGTYQVGSEPNLVIYLDKKPIFEQH